MPSQTSIQSGGRVHVPFASNDAHRSSVVFLGTGPRGNRLVYDSQLYGFILGDHDIPLTDLRALDQRGLIQWHLMEQRDWMRHLDAPQIEALHSEVLAARLSDPRTRSEMDAYIADHVRKDNSYLHGYIVETDKPQSDSAAASKSDSDAEATEEDASTQEGGSASDKGEEKTTRRGRLRRRIEKLMMGSDESVRNLSADNIGSEGGGAGGAGGGMGGSGGAGGGGMGMGGGAGGGMGMGGGAGGGGMGMGGGAGGGMGGGAGGSDLASGISGITNLIGSGVQIAQMRRAARGNDRSVDGAPRYEASYDEGRATAQYADMSSKTINAKLQRQQQKRS